MGTSDRLHQSVKSAAVGTKSHKLNVLEQACQGAVAEARFAAVVFARASLGCEPLHITRRDGNFLSMAGLVNFWKPGTSELRPIPTFTIITTAPSEWMKRIHNRMPVILQDQQIEGWLNSATEMSKLSEMLKPPPEQFLNFYPVDAS